MSVSIVICLGELASAADSFRLGMDAQGNEAFVRFVDALEVVLSEFQEHSRTPEISGMLPAIIERQERGDMVGVADLLEHRVAPAIGALEPRESDPDGPHETAA